MDEEGVTQHGVQEAHDALRELGDQEEQQHRQQHPGGAVRLLLLLKELAALGLRRGDHLAVDYRLHIAWRVAGEDLPPPFGLQEGADQAHGQDGQGEAGDQLDEDAVYQEGGVLQLAVVQGQGAVVQPVDGDVPLPQGRPRTEGAPRGGGQSGWGQ